MSRVTITAGALTAELELVAGRLVSISLPAQIPASFDAAALYELQTELASHPLDLDAAPVFYRRVWERMRQIEVGTAMTYGELAADLGSPGAVRAVGQACATNRLPVVIPCHRVLAENGPGGFALGLEWKRRLLELETELAAPICPR